MNITEKVKFLYNRAEFNRQDNNHPEAIKLYTEGIEQYKYFVFDFQLKKCYLGRCRSHIEIGEYEKAVNDCAEIVKYDINDPDVWLYYGIASFYLGKFCDSLGYLKYSKELSNDHTFVLTWIAYVNFYIGEYQEALLNVKKALQENPTDPWASQLSNKFANLLAQGKLKQSFDNSGVKVIGLPAEYVTLDELLFGLIKVYNGNKRITTVRWDGSEKAASKLNIAIGKPNWQFIYTSWDPEYIRECKKNGEKELAEYEEKIDFLDVAEFLEEFLKVGNAKPILRKIHNPLNVRALVALSAECKYISEPLKEILISDNGKYIFLGFMKSYLIWNFEKDKKELYYESKTESYAVCFLNNEEVLLLEDTGNIKKINIPEKQLSDFFVHLTNGVLASLDVSADKHKLSITTYSKIFLVDLDDFTIKDLRLGADRISSCFFSSVPNTIIYTWYNSSDGEDKVSLFDYVAEKKIFENNTVKNSFTTSSHIHSLERNAFLHSYSIVTDWDGDCNGNIDRGFGYYNLDNRDVNFSASLFDYGGNYDINIEYLGIDAHGTQVIFGCRRSSEYEILVFFDIAKYLVTLYHFSSNLDILVKFPNSRKFIYSSSEVLYLTNME